MTAFVLYTVSGLTIGAFYALIALGYTIVYGIVRMINFAHGDVVMLASFIGMTLATTGILSALPLSAALALLFVVVMLVASILNVGILTFAYRPVIGRSQTAVMITALAVSILIENIIMLIWGAGTRVYPHTVGDSGLSILRGHVHIAYLQIVVFIVSLALMIGLQQFTHRSSLGIAMRALAVDRQTAQLMGIDVNRVVMLAFAIGGALAAAAGVMIGLYYGQIAFTNGFLLGLKGFTAAVIGGIGNIPGAMIGGFVIALAGSYFAGYASSQWTDVLVFGLLVAALIIRPSGILGERVSERV